MLPTILSRLVVFHLCSLLRPANHVCRLGVYILKQFLVQSFVYCFSVPLVYSLFCQRIPVLNFLFKDQNVMVRRSHDDNNVLYFLTSHFFPRRGVESTLYEIVLEYVLVSSPYEKSSSQELRVDLSTQRYSHYVLHILTL